MKWNELKRQRLRNNIAGRLEDGASKSIICSNIPQVWKRIPWIDLGISAEGILISAFAGPQQRVKQKLSQRFFVHRSQAAIKCKPLLSTASAHGWRWSSFPLLSNVLIQKLTKDKPLVMHIIMILVSCIYSHFNGSRCRPLNSLFFRSCDVYRALMNSLVCWFRT